MEAKLNAATTLFILLVADGIAVTGKVEADITLTRADSGSADFEAITFDVEELSLGWYKLTIDANQLNTIGENLISVVCSGADTKYYSIDVVTNLTSDISTLIGALNDISAAEVNAEVVDALGVDTIPELAVAAPAATPTIKMALMLLYMALRNKTILSDAKEEIYNDAGTKICANTLATVGTTTTIEKLA